MEDLNQQTQNDFDNITGLPTEEKENEDIILDLNKVISQSDNFKILKNTPGWLQIESFIKNQSEDLILQLKLSDDFNKIRKLQALIIAFESVLNIIELSCADAEKAKIELDKLIGPEN